MESVSPSSSSSESGSTMSSIPSSPSAAGVAVLVVVTEGAPPDVVFVAWAEGAPVEADGNVVVSVALVVFIAVGQGDGPRPLAAVSSPAAASRPLSSSAAAAPISADSFVQNGLFRTSLCRRLLLFENSMNASLFSGRSSWSLRKKAFTGSITPSHSSSAPSHST